jgi:hypothetical protein
MKDRYRHVRTVARKAWLKRNTTMASIVMDGRFCGRYRLLTHGTGTLGDQLVGHKRLPDRPCGCLSLYYDPVPCRVVVVPPFIGPVIPGWSCCIEFTPRGQDEPRGEGCVTEQIDGLHVTELPTSGSSGFGLDGERGSTLGSAR